MKIQYAMLAEKLRGIAQQFDWETESDADKSARKAVRRALKEAIRKAERGAKPDFRYVPGTRIPAKDVIELGASIEVDNVDDESLSVSEIVAHIVKQYPMVKGLTAEVIKSVLYS